MRYKQKEALSKIRASFLLFKKRSAEKIAFFGFSEILIPGIAEEFYHFPGRSVSVLLPFPF